MAELSAASPFLRVGPEEPVLPVVLSVPHAGRTYRESLLKASRLPLEKLETLEDRLVDRLIWRAQSKGATAIVAQAPRAEIDLNRDEREIDPATIVPPPASRGLLRSQRSRGGLGLIPTRIAGEGSIWLHRIPEAELRRRISEIHAPYHAAIDSELKQARERFGLAILLDCHSMPPREDKRGPGLVFGDRHGTSIDPHLLGVAVTAARENGFDVGLNAPYAGGYVTARHGKPAKSIHAVQLEVDRSLYLDASLRSPGPGFDRVAQMISDVVTALAATAMGCRFDIAAE